MRFAFNFKNKLKSDKITDLLIRKNNLECFVPKFSWRNDHHLPKAVVSELIVMFSNWKWCFQIDGDVSKFKVIFPSLVGRSDVVRDGEMAIFNLRMMIWPPWKNDSNCKFTLKVTVFVNFHNLTCNLNCFNSLTLSLFPNVPFLEHFSLWNWRIVLEGSYVTWLNRNSRWQLMMT